MNSIDQSIEKICKAAGEYGRVIGREVAMCPEHGCYTDVITWRGILGETKSGCPVCEQQRKVDFMRKQDQIAAEEREEIEQDKHRRLSRFKDMNMETAYFDASLDSFETPTPELEHNLARIRDLVNGKIQKIVMTGRNGTGKTYLACAAIHVLGGRIMTMYEISTTIRASYTPLALETEHDIVDKLARLPILVIDEVGRTKGGDAEANWLSHIIDKRHVRRLPLILISNKHTQKTCGKSGCVDCLENYIGEDIMSRLCEGGVLLRFTGADWRKKAIAREIT